MEMELAIGVGFEGNQLTCCALADSGTVVALPLKDLYKRGLPTTARPTRRRIDTNFADWREVSAQEYVGAIGIALHDGIEINHQFFEVEQDSRRFVVPALALMRGLFRPSKYLLPAMFMPQALDQLCRLVQSDGSFSIDVDAVWAHKSRMERTSNWTTLIGWMFSHRSAFAMAGSLHMHAMSGRLAMALPNAQARIVFRGIEVGRTLFVTETTVVAVTPGDAPDFEISGLPKVITLHDRTVQDGGNQAERAKQYAVPLRADGTFELSDDEWSQIKPIIVGNVKSFQLSPNEILNGVLTKLATGTPWTKVDYKVGNWQNASAAFQCWAGNKKLDQVLEILKVSRQTSN
jgi:hypothetical protein